MAGRASQVIRASTPSQIGTASLGVAVYGGSAASGLSIVSREIGSKVGLLDEYLPVALPVPGQPVPTAEAMVSRREVERQIKPAMDALSADIDALRQQIEAQKEQRAINMDHYVDVPTIAKVASRLVFLVCAFSLCLWLLTGFSMVHPAIAMLTMIGCVGFYTMGRMAERSFS
jgi:hypothetical protein